jgi:hypothetical protein
MPKIWTRRANATVDAGNSPRFAVYARAPQQPKEPGVVYAIKLVVLSVVVTATFTSKVIRSSQRMPALPQ